MSEQVGDISHEIAYVARSLTHFPAFYYWIVETANDPAAYDQLLDIAWKLALVFGCALAAEWLIFRLIKRPVALLEARIPQMARAPAQTLAMADPPSSAADVTAAGELHRRHLNLARAWQSLIRLPFVLGRLALELLPVFVFVSVATMLLGTGIGDLATTRLVILAVVNAYALSRGLICVVRALAGPFGLFRVSAETAIYIEIWARRIVTSPLPRRFARRPAARAQLPVRAIASPGCGIIWRSHSTSRCGRCGRSISTTATRCCCNISSAPSRSC